jgi:hypothetical protein
MVKGTLSWAAGDTADKQITIALTADSQDQEYLETLFVRLYNPTNGLSLASPNVSTAHINGLASPVFAGFTEEIIEAKETDGVISIPVHRAGDVNSVLNVDFDILTDSATLNSDFELAEGRLSWTAGQSDIKNIQITLIDDNETESAEDIVLTLEQFGQIIDQITIKIRDDESNLPALVTVSDDMTVNAGGIINLAAIASDPEGYPLSYQWTQISGSPVVIPNDTHSMMAVTAPINAGSLVFEVTVTDDFGATTSKSVTVTVNSNTTTPDTGPVVTPDSGGSGGGALWIFPLAGFLVARRRFTRT